MGDSWLVAIALVVVPALLILAVPRRWLVWTVLLWLLSPFIAYAGYVLWEAAAQPEPVQWLAGALYPLFFASAFLLLPWLGLCLLGFVLGFALRGLFRRSPKPPVLAAAAAFRPPPQPHELQSAGWRSVHVGFANDGLTIAGRDIWVETWRPTGEQVLHLPHPAHPGEIHRYEVHEIGIPGFLARFAASELSNGVWGFYVPTHDIEMARGSSANGAIRYEYSLGEMVGGRYDTIAAWAVVRDATGTILADGSAWLRSRVIPQPDGSLFLHLSLNGSDRLFRLDSEAMSFRDVETRGPDRPLSELAAAVEEARLATRRPEPRTTRLAPDGLVRVELESVEWRNSHWVQSPRVIDVPNGRVVLDLWNTDWDATVGFPGPRRVTLSLQRYHEGGALAAELDLERGTYRIVSEYGREGPLPEAPLSGIVAGLEESARRSVVAGGWMVQPPLVVPKPWAAWRTALVILVGAAVAITGIGVIAYRKEQYDKAHRPPGRLDTVPRFEPPAIPR